MGARSEKRPPTRAGFLAVAKPAISELLIWSIEAFAVLRPKPCVFRGSIDMREVEF
jgi:hypothetical protein